MITVHPALTDPKVEWTTQRFCDRDYIHLHFSDTADRTLQISLTVVEAQTLETALTQALTDIQMRDAVSPEEEVPK